MTAPTSSRENNIHIVIKTIPHSEQRYDTVGDYWEDKDGSIQFRVSKMSDWRYEFLVAVHELVEKFLCVQAGVTDEEITRFDINFEKERIDGKWDGQEPGDDPRSPYRLQHSHATSIERILAIILLVDWGNYDKEVMSL